MRIGRGIRWLCSALAAGVAVCAITASSPAQVRDLANAMCPVMEEEPASEDVYTDYGGARVHFCCMRCLAKFERDPLPYLAAVGLTPVAAMSQGAPDSARAITPATMTERIGQLAGRLHPVIVHFPIALLVVAGMLELFGAGRGRMRDTVRTCLVLGALAACAAAGMGWLNAHFERGGLPDASTQLLIHRWLGVSAAALAVVLAMAAMRVRRAEAPATAAGGGRKFRVAVVMLALMVAVGGHFGGMMVYGSDYLWEVFERGSGKRAIQAPAPNESGPRAQRENVPPAPDRSALRADVLPAATPPAAQTSQVAAATALLFETSDESAFLARRALRLTLVAPPPSPPAASGPAFNEIDRFVTAKWREAGLSEAQRSPAVCGDEAFLRRAYLDVIGVIPTIEESRRFLDDASSDKRAKLVDELLARSTDYADHWTPFWEDALGSSHVQLQGGVPTRGSYRKWINDSFKANKPFDVLAAELIDTAMPGAKKPEIAEANTRKSRISYIRNETHTDTLQSAAAVAQVFMGTGMKCASCHNHFENDEWTQARVLGFAGLFCDKDLELIRCEKRSGKFAAAAFPFELPGAPADVPTDEASRLRRAAQLLTDPTNPRFAKAIVNRLWKRYMGLGLFEPVDDFRLSVPPSHPELLDWLAYDFMSSGYDIKHTMRLILTSRTYQLKYDPALEDHFDVAKKTEPRCFRSPSLRRLTAEQVVDSIRVAATQRLDPASRLYLRNESTALSRALGKPASRNEISTLRPDDAAVVQALELLNGEELGGLVYSSAILGGGAATEEDRVNSLYRAVLTRAARAEESALAVEYLRSAGPREAGDAAERAVVWIDDGTPEGARLSGTWNWIESADGPVKIGRRAHVQTAKDGKPVQHYSLGGSLSSPVGARDTLWAWVYLDEKDPAREVMVQWNDGVMSNDGGWAHRAYWGEDAIMFGRAGTASRQRMGDLPKAGEWVRLEVPAAGVGFIGAGARVVGLSFDQAGGTVVFDAAGVVSRGNDPSAVAMGDLMWALVAGPEFHYIR